MKSHWIFAGLFLTLLYQPLTGAENQPPPSRSSAPVEQTILSVNFDHETVGVAPGSALRTRSPEGSEIRVVNASSKPADPFGGASNRSLMFSSQEALQFASFGLKHTASPVTKGKLTLDFYVYVDTAAGYGQLGPFLKVALGNDTNGNKALDRGEVACWIDLRESGRMMIRTADGLFYADQTYPANQVNKLEISFDLKKDHWSVLVNGQTITVGKGEIRSFKLKDPVTSINRLSLYNQGQNKQPSRVFTDNLKVTVPSP